MSFDGTYIYATTANNDRSGACQALAESSSRFTHAACESAFIIGLIPRPSPDREELPPKTVATGLSMDHTLCS